ncbi:MAG: HD domain-containing protein [Anaerolineae bacterium]|nr:MAG: HD domain-containing protein [Anaerolineae bacterium]
MLSYEQTGQIVSKRPLYSFALFLALTLLIAAQGFLLVPARLGALGEGLSPGAPFLLAGIFHLSGLTSLAAVLRARSKERERFLLLFPLLATFILFALYARARFVIETLILAGAVGGLAFLLRRPAREEGYLRDVFLGVVSLVNVLAGIALLAAIPAPLSPHYAPAAPWLPVLGALFLLGGIAGGYAFFVPTSGLRKPFLATLTFPWLAWSLTFAINLSLPILLPSILLALTLLLHDAIPWQQIALPPQDVLGRRLFTRASMAFTAILIILTILLDQITSPSHHDLAFLFGLGMSITGIYALATAAMAINSLMAQLGDSERPDGLTLPQPMALGQRLSRLIEPFSLSHQHLRSRLRQLEKQLLLLSQQAEVEKRRATQLSLLRELSQQLETPLDPPVMAQLTVNTLQQAFDCPLASILLYDEERRELVSLATAGEAAATVPAGYRQHISKGVMGRAARKRKTQVVNDTRLDPDHFSLEGQNFLSELAVPLVYHGHLKGVLILAESRPNAFNSKDVSTVETVSAELMRAWERTSYHHRLTSLIQAGISLTALREPTEALQEIAAIARQTLDARFTFAILIDRERNFTRTAHAGYAPALLKSLHNDPARDTLLQAALNAAQPFRVRDLRKFRHASHITLDHSGFRSLLATPIRLRRLTIGAILAFGKHGELFFTENDESLAGLLASQAAATIESSWLYQQLRSSLATTTLLYQLSFRVIQSEKPEEAAATIAETTYQLSNALRAGIVLFAPDQKTIEAELIMDSSGPHRGKEHPLDIINQALETGQSIILSPEPSLIRLCFPLQTPLRKYGALWLDTSESHWNNSRYTSDLQTLVNQATIALERALLLVESRQHAQALENAYRELETTYDRTLAALMAALDARDRETEGHSWRVAQIACRLGEALGLSPEERKALERGSLLHDIGKIGISDTILHKPGPLSADEWKIMRLHPEIGARIVEDIPFLQDTLPVIRYHQERWDGSGYPIGLSGTDIPLLARIFAVADAFDALTSNRPYRGRISAKEALRFLREQAGILFDPQIVSLFEKLIAEGKMDDLITL